MSAAAPLSESEPQSERRRRTPQRSARKRAKSDTIPGTGGRRASKGARWQGARAAGARGNAPAVLGNNTNRVSPAAAENAGSRAQNARQTAYKLRDDLRPYARARIAKCGYCRVRSDVEIVRANGRATIRGVMRCGSVWECPACSLAVKVRRAQEVVPAVNRHGTDRVYLLTLTVRHATGDDLRLTRQGVSGAWQRVQRGAPWGRFKDRMGIVGSIRALEVTHGSNGWHPHLHILLFARKLDESALAAAQSFLSDRWKSAVSRELGASNAPLDEVGCRLDKCHRADYIAKIGLEMTNPGTKSGRNGGRCPLQIARDFVESGDDRDRATWAAYCRGMKGARMLTWSKGLREQAGLVEDESDEAIATADEASEAEVETLLTIPGRTWDQVRKVNGAACRLLDAADKGGAILARECLAALVTEWAHATRIREARDWPAERRRT